MDLASSARITFSWAFRIGMILGIVMGGAYAVDQDWVEQHLPRDLRQGSPSEQLEYLRPYLKSEEEIQKVVIILMERASHASSSSRS